MHHTYIDRLALGDSPVHRLDARAKLLTVVAYTGVLLSYDRYAVSALVPMVIGPLGFVWFGGVPLGYVLRPVAMVGRLGARRVKSSGKFSFLKRRRAEYEYEDEDD